MRNANYFVKGKRVILFESWVFLNGTNKCQSMATESCRSLWKRDVEKEYDTESKFSKAGSNLIR